MALCDGKMNVRSEYSLVPNQALYQAEPQPELDRPHRQHARRPFEFAQGRQCTPQRHATEISCARHAQVTSSQGNGHVRAFTKSRARVDCNLRFRRICLGACAECFPAIAPARPQGCESCRAQLRSDNDRVRQLQSRCLSATGHRPGSGGSIFHNSGVDPVLGSIAVSRRAHLRARAACARLKL